MTSLPTAGQLQKLPLRAIAAYAARGGRRAAIGLRGVISDEIIEEALSTVEMVASVAHLEASASVSAMLAAAHVAGETARLEGVQPRVARLSVCVCAAARTASAILQMLAEPARAPYYAAVAASAAHRAANSAVALGGNMSLAALEGAKADYVALLKMYGESETVDLGQPVVFTDNTLFGALMDGEWETGQQP